MSSSSSSPEDVFIREAMTHGRKLKEIGAKVESDMMLARAEPDLAHKLPYIRLMCIEHSPAVPAAEKLRTICKAATRRHSF